MSRKKKSVEPETPLVVGGADLPAPNPMPPEDDVGPPLMEDAFQPIMLEGQAVLAAVINNKVGNAKFYNLANMLSVHYTKSGGDTKPKLSMIPLSGNQIEITDPDVVAAFYAYLTSKSDVVYTKN